MLAVKDLRLTYQTDQGNVDAVRGVSFTVEHGNFYTLLGPSGCGKTSTLRCIAGLETPSSGHIEIGQKVVYSSAARTLVPPHRRDIGMVFQSYAIWPHMTVYDNVAFPLAHGQKKLPRKVVRERVMRALSLVQLDALAQRPAPQLSGGQQQRVALARAIAKPRDVYLNPADAFAANFLGRTNLLHGSVAAGRVETRWGALVCALPAWALEGSQIAVGFRPESVLLSQKAPPERDNVLQGKLASATYAGDTVEYLVDIGGHMVRVKGQPFEPIEEGWPVFLRVPAERCYVLEGMTTNPANPATTAVPA